MILNTNNYILLITLLISLAGLSNAIMDLSSENLFFKKWWNKGESWNNKNKFKHPVLKWLFRKPLVFLTDGWHLFQFIHTSFLYIAILLQAPLLIGPVKAILAFFYFKFIYGVSFTALYTNYKKYSLRRRASQEE